MKTYLQIIIFLLMGSITHAQFYLDQLTYQNDTSAGTKNFIAVADSQFIYIFGENYNNDRFFSQIDPYILKYNYQGDFISDKYQRSFAEESFGKDEFLLHKNGHRYFISREDNYHDDFEVELREVDIYSGKSIRAVYLGQIEIKSMRYNSDFEIEILSVKYPFWPCKECYISGHILTLDTSLNLIDDIMLWDSIEVKKSYESPCMIFLNKDLSNGFNILGQGSIKSNYGLMNWHYDSLGNLLLKKLIPQSNRLFLERSKAVLNTPNNDVVMGMTKKDSLSNNRELAMLSYNSNLDELNWKVSLSQTNNDANKNISINTICFTHDSLAYIALSTRASGISNTQNEGLLFKVSKDGIIEWSRMFKPLQNVGSPIINLELNTVTASPYGYVILGKMNYAGKSNSFLLHTDKHGCLIPGCHLPVTTTDEGELILPPFKIYPNPVRDQLYLLSRISSKEQHIIKIYNMNGEEVLNTSITPQESAQYMVHLPPSLSKGMHVLAIENPEGNVVFTKTIVVQ